MSEGIARGIAHRTVEDTHLDGRVITLDAHRAINFASCSYLGLEVDPRLKAAAIDAVERLGTQFSSSRSYLSAPPYAELEVLIGEMTGGHALVTPNTTLAHLSALPVIIGEEDAVILDHQVHHTVQLAVPQLRQQGARIEFIRHERMDQLDARIGELARHHPKVWYLADGVYSMYGNLAATDALRWLSGEHEQLHLYIDDAHGTSWRGRHGRGFALSELAGVERCFVAMSLNKAFAAAGGALVFPDAETRDRVAKCGGPMIFTGPLQPPMLGAAIASARIHLSEEISSLQCELMERVQFANRTAAELGVPLANTCEVPIRFVALGKPVIAYDMVEHLLERGMLTNCAVFPAVPAKRCGVRFTLTRHQSLDDIRNLLEAVAEYLPAALKAAGSSREQIDADFGLTPKAKNRSSESSTRGLQVQRETSIQAIDCDSWNRCLDERGSFDWQGLAYLESVFAAPDVDEANRWRFHYFVVRDASDTVLLATFFTEALWKDDMLSSSTVSKRVEAHRQHDPRFLTSKVLSMGSLLTEGDHLYLNRSADWQRALAWLLDEVNGLADDCGASSIVLRDLDPADTDLSEVLGDAGFSVVAGPDSLALEVDWRDWNEHVAGLDRKKRQFHRRHVAPHENHFSLEVLGADGRIPAAEELTHLYGLYRNVKEQSLELNTFALPGDCLSRMLSHPNWEIVTLTLKPDIDTRNSDSPHAFFAAYVGPVQYAPMIIGLDYRAVGSHSAYRQCLRQICARAQARGSERVLLGMGAALEKERFGAQRIAGALYVQSRDHYQHDVMSLLDGTGKD
jgi:7-keto-8-aminopelargonate synthetase-like enzyme